MFALTRNIAQSIRNAVRGKHTLPKLPYEYNALEPIISCEILEVHHGKHHQTYVNNLNALETQLEEAKSKNDHNKMVALAPAHRFNYGGHLNHWIYWDNLSPTKSEPSAVLKKALEQQFCSFEQFKKDMTAMTVAIQGSGWGLLGYDTKYKQLRMVAISNQEPFEASTGMLPLLCIDVWEHAYYLQYKNLRPKYVEAIWDIINWEEISKRYAASACK